MGRREQMPPIVVSYQMNFPYNVQLDHHEEHTSLGAEYYLKIPKHHAVNFFIKHFMLNFTADFICY